MFLNNGKTYYEHIEDSDFGYFSLKIVTSDENIYVQDISLHKFNETNYEHIDKTDFDKTKM